MLCFSIPIYGIFRINHVRHCPYRGFQMILFLHGLGPEMSQPTNRSAVLIPVDPRWPVGAPLVMRLVSASFPCCCSSHRQGAELWIGNFSPDWLWLTHWFPCGLAVEGINWMDLMSFSLPFGDSSSAKTIFLLLFHVLLILYFIVSDLEAGPTDCGQYV